MIRQLIVGLACVFMAESRGLKGITHSAQFSTSCSLDGIVFSQDISEFNVPTKWSLSVNGVDFSSKATLLAPSRCNKISCTNTWNLDETAPNSGFVVLTTKFGNKTTVASGLFDCDQYHMRGDTGDKGDTGD